jgi:hypothetical protein
MSDEIPAEDGPTEKPDRRAAFARAAATLTRRLAVLIMRGAEHIDAWGERRPPAVEGVPEDEDVVAKPSAWSRMIDAERAFCIVSVLPLIVYLALPFLKRQLDDSSALGILPLGAMSIMFSWLLGGIGLVAVVYGQRAGRPVWPTLIASAVAGGVVIWSIVQSVIVLVLRPYLIELGLY